MYERDEMKRRPLEREGKEERGTKGSQIDNTIVRFFPNHAIFNCNARQLHTHHSAPVDSVCTDEGEDQKKKDEKRIEIVTSF